MLFFVRSTCGSGEISRAQQRLVSRRWNNIVLGGVGVRVLRKDEEIERTKVFHHIFVSVPRTFGDYCRSVTPLKILSFPFVRMMNLLFSHFPLFLSIPMIRTISPNFGIHDFPLLMRCTSIRLCNYSFCHLCHTCSLAFFNLLCIFVKSFSSTFVSSKTWQSFPRIIMFDVNTWLSSLSFSTFVTGR